VCRVVRVRPCRVAEGDMWAYLGVHTSVAIARAQGRAGLAFVECDAAVQCARHAGRREERRLLQLKRERIPQHTTRTHAHTHTQGMRWSNKYRCSAPMYLHRGGWALAQLSCFIPWMVTTMLRVAVLIPTTHNTHATQHIHVSTADGLPLLCLFDGVRGGNAYKGGRGARTAKCPARCPGESSRR
jgi:hypothetical protein